MNWNKLKQQLESFLHPNLIGKVEYRASGYRYSPDKKAQCYMLVDKKEIFNMKTDMTDIRWYASEQEIKNDESIIWKVTSEDIESIRVTMPKVPDERLESIAIDRKKTQASKLIMKSQAELVKEDFRKKASDFLAMSIEDSLNSDDIVLNVLAIIDRRVGKKRLKAMENDMRLKAPIVQFFYDMRR